LINEKKGRNVSKSKSKAATLDKWVTREILEYLDEVEEQNIEKPISSEEVQEIIEEMEDSDQSNDPNVILGQKINQELSALAESNPGVTEFNIDEIASKIPATHKQIFDHYEDSGPNGVKTPNWEFIENQKAIFTLKKR